MRRKPAVPKEKITNSGSWSGGKIAKQDVSNSSTDPMAYQTSPITIAWRKFSRKCRQEGGQRPHVGVSLQIAHGPKESAGSRKHRHQGREAINQAAFRSIRLVIRSIARYRRLSNISIVAQS